MCPVRYELVCFIPEDFEFFIVTAVNLENSYIALTAWAL
jgi:hypothetical protein